MGEDISCHRELMPAYRPRVSSRPRSSIHVSPARSLFVRGKAEGMVVPRGYPPPLSRTSGRGPNSPAQSGSGIAGSLNAAAKRLLLLVTPPEPVGAVRGVQKMSKSLGLWYALSWWTKNPPWEVRGGGPPPPIQAGSFFSESAERRSSPPPRSRLRRSRDAARRSRRSRSRPGGRRSRSRSPSGRR